MVAWTLAGLAVVGWAVHARRLAGQRDEARRNALALWDTMRAGQRGLSVAVAKLEEAVGVRR